MRFGSDFVGVRQRADGLLLAKTPVLPPTQEAPKGCNRSLRRSPKYPDIVEAMKPVMEVLLTCVGGVGLVAEGRCRPAPSLDPAKAAELHSSLHSGGS